MERADGRRSSSGAGIVGLATARAMQARAPPAPTCAVLDKEAAPGAPPVRPQLRRHPRGRLLRAGLGEGPALHRGPARRWSSSAASTASRTRSAARSSSRSTTAERARLAELEQRCRENGVRVELIGPEQLRELEPHAAGVAALRVLDTGIADFTGGRAARCADEIEAAGGDGRSSTPRCVGGTERAEGLVVETTGATIVAAAGRHVRRAAGRPGRRRDQRPRRRGAGCAIVPFRGEYFELLAERVRTWCATLDLPGARPAVPVPRRAPHPRRSTATCTSARTRCSRSRARATRGARSTSRDVRDTLRFPGFRKLAAKYWRYGAAEMARSVSKRRFTHALQRLVPEVTVHDLEPRAAGVRAQAVAGRRHARRRLRVPAGRPRAARPQRAVARRHRLPRDRPRHHRPPRPRRLTAAVGRTRADSTDGGSEGGQGFVRGAQDVERAVPALLLVARSSPASAARSGRRGRGRTGRLAHTSSPTRTDTGMIAPIS